MGPPTNRLTYLLYSIFVCLFCLTNQIRICRNPPGYSRTRWYVCHVVSLTLRPRHRRTPLRGVGTYCGTQAINKSYSTLLSLTPCPRKAWQPDEYVHRKYLLQQKGFVIWYNRTFFCHRFVLQMYVVVFITCFRRMYLLLFVIFYVTWQKNI